MYGRQPRIIHKWHINYFICLTSTGMNLEFGGDKPQLLVMFFNVKNTFLKKINTNIFFLFKYAIVVLINN